MLVSLSLYGVLQQPNVQTPGNALAGKPANSMTPEVVKWTGDPLKYNYRQLELGERMDGWLIPKLLNDNGDVVATYSDYSQVLITREGPSWILPPHFHPSTLGNDRRMWGPQEYTNLAHWSMDGGLQISTVPDGYRPYALNVKGDWIASREGALDVPCFVSIGGRLQELTPASGYKQALASRLYDNRTTIGISRNDQSDAVVTVWKTPDKPQVIKTPAIPVDHWTLFVTNSGVVAGSCFPSGYDVSRSSDLQSFAFVTSGGHTKLIPFDRPVFASAAVDMNERGDVVGYAFFSRDTPAQAWLYRDGRTYMCADLAGNVQWVESRAYCINSKGQIAGYARKAETANRGFILTPPEAK